VCRRAMGARELANPIASYFVIQLIRKKSRLAAIVVVIHIMGRGSLGQRLLTRAADGDGILRR
jgi:hypothetical protein